MLNSEFILTMALLSEVRQPMVGEKFHNSDKSWEEVILAKNSSVINTAFKAAEIAFTAQPPHADKAYQFS